MNYEVTHSEEYYNVSLACRLNWRKIILTDSFTGIIGSLINDSDNWNEVWDDFVLTPTAIYNTSNDVQHAAYASGTFTPNQYAKAVVQTDGATDYMGVGVRLSADGSGYSFAIALNFNAVLRRFDADGTHYSILSGSIPYSASPVTLELIIVDSTIYCYANGVLVFEYDDESYTSGSPGVTGRFAGDGSYIDSFEGGDIVPQYYNVEKN